jgi:Ran-binding protein 9/10
MEKIDVVDVANLYPPLSSSQLLHKLIAQYLAHDGYVGTARAFAQEVGAEYNALHGPNAAPSELEPDEDRDAVNRRKIRSAIMNGDIDAALIYAERWYPDVLKANSKIYFRLKCLKFIEMMRRSLGGDEPKTVAGGAEDSKRRGKRRETLDFGDVFTQEMDLDDQHNHQPAANGNSTAGPQEWGAGSAMAVDSEVAYDDDDEEDDIVTKKGKGHSAMVTDRDLVEYGIELRKEYGDDPRREIQDELQRTLGLISYGNPNQSVLKDLLEVRKRMSIAEELNSAILGKSTCSILLNDGSILTRIYSQPWQIIHCRSGARYSTDRSHVP